MYFFLIFQKNEKIRPFSSFRESDFINNPIVIEEEDDKQAVFRKKIQDYIIGKELGKGAYAVVKAAIHKPTSMKVAIKIFDKVKLMDPVKKTVVKKEIDILKMTNHPNIVKLYEVIDTPKQVYLILLDPFSHGISTRCLSPKFSKIST
jgi:serine/threonine protein kinase